MALIARRFPDLAGRPVTLIGSGWDNDVWQVSAAASDAAWLVRVPRRALGAEVLPFEAAALPIVEATVARPLGVAVPGSARLGPAPAPDEGPVEGDDFRWPVLAVRRVDGDEVGRVAAPMSARAALAEPLARFLRALHAVPADQLAGTGVPHGRHVTMDPEHRVRMVATRFTQARAAGLALPPSVEEVFAAEAATWVGLLPREGILCHGDLHLRHVMVDASGSQLRGIIDWGDVHVGDPAIDLAVAPMVLPPSAWPAFFSVYGPIDSPTWRLARLRAWTASIALAVSCHDVGEVAICTEALAALERLTETSGDGVPGEGISR